MTRKNNEKRSFVFYDSFLEAMKHLNDSDFRECVMKIRDYALEGVDEESDSPMVNVIMALAKPNLEAARRRYETAVENGKKGAEYGKLGGAPRGNQNARKKQPLNQPQKQPLDVDVEEDVNINENEEVDVNGDAPMGTIGSHSSFSNSSIGFIKEIENDSERFEEREEMKEPLQEVNQYQSNDLIVGTASKGKGETPINSNSENSNSVLASPYTEKGAGDSANRPQRRKEPGMDMSEYMKQLIRKDIVRLANMLVQGQEYDKIVLNRAIDNLIALYGRHDRKSGYKEILSAVERYAHDHL